MIRVLPPECLTCKFGGWLRPSGWHFLCRGDAHQNQQQCKCLNLHAQNPKGRRASSLCNLSAPQGLYDRFGAMGSLIMAAAKPSLLTNCPSSRRILKGE